MPYSVFMGKNFASGLKLTERTIWPVLAQLWLVALLLGGYCGSAIACGMPPSPGQVPQELLGWTADGRYLAYTYNRLSGEFEGAIEGSFAATFDTRSDETTSYLLELTIDEDYEPDKEEMAGVRKWQQLPDAAAFKTWTDNHKVSKQEALDTCDQVKLRIQSEDLTGFSDADAVLTEWVDGRMEASGDLTRLAVEKHGTTWTHAEFQRGGSLFVLMMGYPWVEVAWSPTCNHIAYMIPDYVCNSRRSISYYSLPSPFIIKPAGPVIHIMAHESAQGTLEPIYDALASAGFYPHIGPNALKARTKTVIYARKPAWKAAEQLAAAVPGGATVEPLTWKSAADIIVAAGTSALQ